MIDVPLPTLNAAFGFLDVLLQEGSFHGHLTDQRWKVGYFLLDPRLSDRSPLRLARDDHKNNHRAETEAGFRRIGRPSRGRNAVTPPITSSAETTACPNGTGAHRGGHGLPGCRWRDWCAGCLKPAAASDLMQSVPRSCFDRRLLGPGLATEKPWTPLLRIGDATSNAALKPDWPIELHVTENRARERRNVRAKCAV
jgi:hypothetical protein